MKYVKCKYGWDNSIKHLSNWTFITFSVFSSINIKSIKRILKFLQTHKIQSKSVNGSYDFPTDKNIYYICFKVVKILRGRSGVWWAMHIQNTLPEFSLMLYFSLPLWMMRIEINRIQLSNHSWWQDNCAIWPLTNIWKSHYI